MQIIKRIISTKRSTSRLERKEKKMIIDTKTNYEFFLLINKLNFFQTFFA